MKRAARCIDRKISKVCETRLATFSSYAMLTLAVPEAAASSDTIQFKLVLGGEVQITILSSGSCLDHQHGNRNLRSI